jgi:hypothetical protein
MPLSWGLRPHTGTTRGKVFRIPKYECVCAHSHRAWSRRTTDTCPFYSVELNRYIDPQAGSKYSSDGFRNQRHAVFRFQHRLDTL